MEGIKQSMLDAFIDAALREDIKDGDHTSLACVANNRRDKAELLIKETGIIAGVEFAQHVFKRLDPECDFEVKIADGTRVKPNDVAFEVESYSRIILKAERVILNSMQRMSGIATLSRKFAEKVADLNVVILDTRKTTPLLRFLEKWAVRIGGCQNYRDGLYDRFMIKDNHIDACGSIAKAIFKVHQYKKEKSLDLGITIEVRNMNELQLVMDSGGVDRIMLDNFKLSELRKAVDVIDGSFETEASGGVTLDTVRAIADTGVDYISVGALTHSAGTMDMSLKIKKNSDVSN